MSRYDAGFVFCSPLQYFLSRIISHAYFPDKNIIGIQYSKNPNYDLAIAAIDDILGPSPFDQKTYSHGDDLSSISIDRVFLSNRFNPEEISLYFQTRKNRQYLCAFEDGIAIYIPFAFSNSSQNEKVIKNIVKYQIESISHRLIGKQTRTANLFPMKEFDEVYSIFPDVKGLKENARQFDISKYIASLSTSKPTTHSKDHDNGETCLFLSQCIASRNSFMNPDHFIDFVISIINELKLKYKTVMYKPHPADYKYITNAIVNATGCDPVPAPYDVLPVEVYLAVHRNIDTYGFFTSSLPYASHLYGVNAYSLMPLLLSKSQTTPTLADTWNAIAPLFRKAGVNIYKSDTLRAEPVA